MISDTLFAPVRSTTATATVSGHCRSTRTDSTGARAAKGVTRVWARGRPSSQFTIRDTFIAAAMHTC